MRRDSREDISKKEHLVRGEKDEEEEEEEDDDDDDDEKK